MLYSFIIFRTTLYNMSGSPTEPLYFYYDTTIPYLSGAHLPITILAGKSLAIVTPPFPILLFVYQFKFFQAILSCCCSIRFREGLRTFMEAFQGYYWDGSDGGRDYRFFDSIYILMRMIYFLTHTMAAYYIRLTMSILVGVMYVMVRPYKRNIFNIIDGCLLVNTGFMYLLTILIYLFNQLGYGISFIKVAAPVVFVLPLV